MTTITFGHLTIASPTTVEPDENGIVRMPEATITMDGHDYVAKDVVVYTKENRFEYPRASGGIVDWRMETGRASMISGADTD